MRPANADDRLTFAALGVVAFVVANVSHEAVGHGLATLAVGGKVDLLTTCYLDSSGKYSKWIPAAGGLTNLAVGLGSLAFLRVLPHLRSVLRYFLILVAAFNLFFAVAYPAYSGIAQFRDWGCRRQWFKPALALAGCSDHCCCCGLLRKHEIAHRADGSVCWRGRRRDNDTFSASQDSRAHTHSLHRVYGRSVFGGFSQP
jgi:hypothetical protein